MFALLSVVECPLCGEAITLAGFAFEDEPLLEIVICTSCRKQLQVRQDPETEETVVEERKVS